MVYKIIHPDRTNVSVASFAGEMPDSLLAFFASEGFIVESITEAEARPLLANIFNAGKKRKRI